MTTAKLYSLLKRIYRRIISLICFFSSIATCRCIDISSRFILRRELYLIHGSLFDKYCSLSYLYHLNHTFHRGAIFIASENDANLISLFSLSEFTLLTPHRLFQSVASCCLHNPLIRLRDEHSRTSPYRTRYCLNGLRSSNLLHYPYLWYFGNVATTTTHFLHLVAYNLSEVSPFIPKLDANNLESFTSASPNHSLPSLCINVPCFTYKQLSIKDYQKLIALATSLNFCVTLNISPFRATDSLHLSLKQRYADLIISNIKQEQVPSFFNQFNLVIGVMGGGMNLAAQYTSRPSIITLQTEHLYHSDIRTKDSHLYHEDYWSWIADRGVWPTTDSPTRLFRNLSLNQQDSTQNWLNPELLDQIRAIMSTVVLNLNPEASL